MNEMNIMTMKKADFQKVPLRESWNCVLPAFDSLVIIPERKFHDSGFRCITFVGCKGTEPVFKTSGCSDVLHIDGIGGYGKQDWTKNIPSLVLPKGWAMDCLPCGYLRLFCHSHALNAGNDLSSFDVFAERVL